MKPVKKLEDLVKDKRFNFPTNLATDRDTGVLGITVTLGGVKTVIPVGEFTPITYQVYCLLRDIGKINPNDHFEEGEEFNPI